MNVLKHVTLDGVRIHLKTDENKLWINSKYTLFLNNTSTFIIEKLIDNAYEVPKDEVPNVVIQEICSKYKVSKKQAKKDFDVVIGIINSFARDEIPTNLVGTEIIKNENKTAPNRMDLALTYKCNNNCSHCYLKENKNMNGTLNTNQWKKIIDDLWKIGIPQIVFTGGEPTLRYDLVELVEYSKQFIVGIITNGTLLSKELTDKLSISELDWIQITLESDDKDIHNQMQGRTGAFRETINGIDNAISSNLSVSVNATLTKLNYKGLKNLLDYAYNLGVRQVSTNAIINSGRGINVKKELGIDEKELNFVLKDAKNHAEKIGMGFNWFLPSCYKNLNPIELGFGQRCCSACSINMLINPSGNIHPCQSFTNEKLGNILKDDWESIWNHHLAIKLRNYEIYPEDCKNCNYLDICHGGCPLNIINKEEKKCHIV